MRKYTKILSFLTVLILLCSAAAMPAFAEYELVVPEEYKETGTLPVYRAVKNDFTSVVQPEWLNQSGITEKWDTGAFFNDHAELFCYPESISYSEFTGEMYELNRAEREENPEIEPDMGKKNALPQDIKRLARAVYAGMREYAQGVSLEHEQLTLISLAEARQTAEAFMEKLGMEDQGYELAYALDMDLERIRTMGEKYNRERLDEGLNDDSMQDYTAAVAEDEGYFLLYTLLGSPRISYHDYHLELYVTSRGIEDAYFGAEYRREEIVDTPAELISPDEAAARFYEELAASESRRTADSLDRISLCYMPVRAQNKKDSMVFIPAWQISYTWRGRNRHWAYINAIDGKLIDAVFK